MPDLYGSFVGEDGSRGDLYHVEGGDGRPSWDEVFMGFARSLALRSTCSRLKVGCVVASSDNQRVLAIGYNGSYRGGPNSCDSTEPGACGCCHAEANAMVKLNPTDPHLGTLYCTHSMCRACAKHVINAGIGSVVYGEVYRDLSGIDLLVRSGKVRVRMHRP